MDGYYIDIGTLSALFYISFYFYHRILLECHLLFILTFIIIIKYYYLSFYYYYFIIIYLDIDLELGFIV